MKYKAVCFDIDGTLYEPEQINMLPRRAAILHPMLVSNYYKMRQVYRDSQKDYPSTELPYMSAMPLRQREATLLAERKFKPGTREFKLATWHYANVLQHKYYNSLIRRYRKLKVTDGVRKLFEELDKAGIKIGLLSDWPVADKAKVLGVDDLCHKVLSTDDCGYLKPDPRAFQYLCAEMGSAPEETLYVGDSYVKDVNGAHAYGMDAVLVNNRKEGDYPNAMKVFGCWNDFDAWLRSQMEV